MARTRRYQYIHHFTLEDYAREHLDIGRRQMFYLLALDRALTEFPLLRERFLEGRLTMKQALAVGRVANPATLAAWITRAECTTLRRLEDEVDHWRHLKETRPRVWALLNGLPLPEGTRLSEGEFAQLRENEQPAGGNDSSPEHGVHGSAQQSTQPTSTITAAQLSEAVAADEAADPLPLVTLCNAHHKMLHEGIIRVYGEAPDDLTWEMGIEKGRGPYRTYRGHRRLVSASAT